jgi:hypothetical protein
MARSHLCKRWLQKLVVVDVIRRRPAVVAPSPDAIHVLYYHSTYLRPVIDFHIAGVVFCSGEQQR